LLDKSAHLVSIIEAIRQRISIPFTVKIRIFGDERDIALAVAIEAAGADALIVHGRRWSDEYEIPCDRSQIAKIKDALTIPVIANGDIFNDLSLHDMRIHTECDAYMISRAGCGNPWIYQHLLEEKAANKEVTFDERHAIFMTHLEGLARLENHHQAVLQSKTLVRYYFKTMLNDAQCQHFYTLDSLLAIERFLLGISGF